MKNIKDQIRLAKLLVKEVLNSLSEEESAQLDSWKSIDANNALHASILNKNSIDERNDLLKNIDADFEWNKFVQAVETKKASRHKRMHRQLFYRIASVAAVLALVFSIYFINQDFKNEKLVAVVESEIQPGKSQAVLVLASGEEVNLEQNSIAKYAQGGVQITNKNGVLAYNANANQAGSTQNNILRIPRGGEYQLVLPDGTKVWLNSDTELKFPVSFSGNQRRVELIGEAYFEVSHNPKQPFIVATDHQEIRVLGTHFNVSAYSDDENTVTTLVEGKVKIGFGEEKQHHDEFLNPGQQLVLSKKTNLSTKLNVDAYLFTSWKDGRFILRDESLEQFMKKISRWYNVDILFVDEETKGIRFTGDLPRYENLKDVMKILQYEMSVNIKVESNKLIYISK